METYVLLAVKRVLFFYSYGARCPVINKNYHNEYKTWRFQFTFLLRYSIVFHITVQQAPTSMVVLTLL